MRFLILTAFACSVLAVYAQACPPTEVVFLIDQSENAARTSSRNRWQKSGQFGILINELIKFLTNPTIANAVNFRIGAIGYSSSFKPITIIPTWSTPAQALNWVNLFPIGIVGGSWTYRGLEMVNHSSIYSNNWVIVLSSQGSGTIERKNLAKTQFERVLALGWKIYVVALQGLNPLDLEELTIVNNGRQPVILTEKNPLEPMDPKGYTELSNEFPNIINNILCPASTTTTTIEKGSGR